MVGATSSDGFLVKRKYANQKYPAQKLIGKLFHF